ncbi:LysM peptidoglycan-binding domain-containing protein [Nocardioides sp. URHA0032]|uniref:LysM peptidoglycan-binding domain-containing protein n=1 Tax=Nocardioides sp. URHA0032 TaxID=1380388 RepID=UPI0009DE5DD0|nr:LysM peptidoglycan-binding domain-containing protein [Nocardioides sp. URHA0032]
MHAPVHRCLAVALTATAAAVALVGWLAPVALAPASGFDGALVRLCATVGSATTAWLWCVTGLVVLEALRGGSWETRGVPAGVRRALLAACGLAVVAGLATPAGATSGRHDQPQTAASVVATAIAGLPLPDRPHGPAHDRRAQRLQHLRPAPVVTVRRGDSLWSIADEHLGTGDRWPEIYALNRAVVGADPDLIQPAQRLRIPLRPQENR